MIENSFKRLNTTMNEQAISVLSPSRIQPVVGTVLASDAESKRRLMPLEVVNYNLYRDPETGFQFEWDTREAPGKVRLVLYLEPYLEPRIPILDAVMEDSWRTAKRLKRDLTQRVLTGSKSQVRGSFLGNKILHARYKHDFPAWLTEKSLDELLRIATSGWT